MNHAKNLRGFAEKQEDLERRGLIAAANALDKAEAEVARLREALENLEKAERNYRHLHDAYGDDNWKSGRAWDALRRAGDKARVALGTPGEVG